MSRSLLGPSAGLGSIGSGALHALPSLSSPSQILDARMIAALHRNLPPAHSDRLEACGPLHAVCPLGSNLLSLLLSVSLRVSARVWVFLCHLPRFRRMDVALFYVSRSWQMTYSLIRDGAALTTLADSASRQLSYLLVVEDSWGYVFGAFLPSSLSMRMGNRSCLQIITLLAPSCFHSRTPPVSRALSPVFHHQRPFCAYPWPPRYYGTGETWIFSFHNLPPEEIAIYRWTRANELFVISSPDQLAFGGGGGFGMSLDGDLDNGVSNSCATFGNRRLSSTEFFKTLNVELFALTASFVQPASAAADARAPNSGSGDLEYDI